MRKPPPNRRFSPEAVDGLARRYNAGASTAELAAEHGVTPQRMNALLLTSELYVPRGGRHRRRRLAA